MGTGTRRRDRRARAPARPRATASGCSPHERDREALARAYRARAASSCPASSRRSGSSPSRPPRAARPWSPARPRRRRARSAPLADTFAPGDVDGLLAAIERARAREPDRLAAARFAAAHRWEHAFAAELADLEALAAADEGARTARRRAARRRARDVPALRADPRLARRPRRRPRDAAGHPGAAAAPVHALARPSWPTGCSTAATPATRSPSTASSTGGRARAAAARPCGSWQGGDAAEFPGPDADATAAGVEAGRRILAAAGLPPRGFVAPGYAYTGALRAAPRRSASTGGRRCSRLHGRAPSRSPGAVPRHVRPRSSARRRRRSCAPARPLPASCCGSTCTRPTSTTRATCSRSSGCCERAARRDGGDLRRPLLKGGAVLRANWREGVRRDGTPFAFTCPSPRRYQHQWYWDSCFHAIAWSHIDPGAGARGAAHAAARRARRRLRPAHRVLAGVAALAPRAALRDRRLPRRHRDGVDPDAAARGRVGARRRPATREFAPSLAPLQAHARWLIRERDPDGDGLITILLPDESGLDDSPKYDAGLRPARALAARLRAARPALPARPLERARRSPATTDEHVEDVLVNVAHALSLRALARLTGEPEWDAHAARTETALLERCWDERRGLFFDLAGRDERRVEVSTWSSLAPLALATAIPREIRERLAERAPAATRAATARASACRRCRWRSRRSGPGFNAYRHVARRGLDEHRVAAGRRACGRSARTTRPTRSRSGVAGRGRAQRLPRVLPPAHRRRPRRAALRLRRRSLLDLPTGFCPPTAGSAIRRETARRHPRTDRRRLPARDPRRRGPRRGGARALARHQPVQAGVLGLRSRRRDRRGRGGAGGHASSASRRTASTRPAKWENPSRRRPSTTRWPRSPPTAS